MLILSQPQIVYPSPNVQTRMPAKLITNIFLEAFVDFPRLILVSEETTKVLLASFQRTLKALFILITPRDIHQAI